MDEDCDAGNNGTGSDTTKRVDIDSENDVANDTNLTMLMRAKPMAVKSNAAPSMRPFPAI